MFGKMTMRFEMEDKVHVIDGVSVSDCRCISEQIYNDRYNGSVEIECGNSTLVINKSELIDHSADLDTGV